jgi:hypothetical protein
MMQQYHETIDRYLNQEKEQGKVWWSADTKGQVP